MQCETCACLHVRLCVSLHRRCGACCRNAESRSGDGSTIAYTANIRTLLARALRDYSVKTWIDAPCGDCNWQPTVEGAEQVQYLGLDIVPGVIAADNARYAGRANLQFTVSDFVNNALPHAPDVVLCRDMIQHNTLRDGVRTYANFEASGAKYLVTTTHHRGTPEFNANVNIPSGSHYEVNVFLPPFNFSAPSYWIREGPEGGDPQGKFVGLWELPALGEGDGLGFNPSAEDWTKAAGQIVDVPAGAVSGAVSVGGAGKR